MLFAEQFVVVFYFFFLPNLDLDKFKQNKFRIYIPVRTVVIVFVCLILISKDTTVRVCGAIAFQCL